MISCEGKSDEREFSTLQKLGLLTEGVDSVFLGIERGRWDDLMRRFCDTGFVEWWLREFGYQDNKSIVQILIENCSFVWQN